MSQSFDRISHFLNNQMRMSHIYQPVMLMHLLKNEGQADLSDIAKAILVMDPTQVEYYEHVTRRMPGRVLTNNRGLTERDGRTYTLIGFSELSDSEIEELIEVCMHEVEGFLQARTASPWRHRRRSHSYVSGSKRYIILRDAGFRCQLCGVSADHRALEVNHIVPTKFMGSDEVSNLQALCYSCNASKGASDDTDLRDVVERYDDREKGCVLCDPDIDSVLLQNELSFSVTDPFRDTDGHVLIVPKRHALDYFDLYQPELNAIHQAATIIRSRLLENDQSITGFSLGFDSEHDAGQTTRHCHLHLSPRRSHDAGDDLRGRL